MTKKSASTEVDAYAFIKSELKNLGWDTRNPTTHPNGQVYTQNQCLSNAEIKKWLDKKRPEAIVKTTDTILWVIESKSERTLIEVALDDAENYYANRLNQSKALTVKFISGVAGNDADGFLIRSKFLENGNFKSVILNEKEMSGLLSPEIAQRLLRTGKARLEDVPINLPFFLAKAQRINEILHSGAVNINDRARVMAALLLSTIEGTLPSLDAKPKLLIEDINNRAKQTLESQGKPEFFDYVRISLPTSKDNHMKYKRALVETLSELYNLNIQSAMNSGTDVLGQFYEVFLKYGPWAQKMGIVLTPRHITRFAAEVLDIALQDVVYDPTCGTGGFLVAAFDYVKARANKTQIEQFKRNNVFGIDNQPQLACLAVVNMIFRGDGKNNIIEGDCFTKWLAGTKRNGTVGFPVRYVNAKPSSSELSMISKVLMNPPFAVTKDDPKEYRFVQQALDQMVDGGLLFSILPVGAMFESGEEYEWRMNRLLAENTLISVVTFPPELFYPIGVHTLGIFVRKGMAHPKKQDVLWVRAVHDGHVKIKGKRLPWASEPNELEKTLPMMNAFIHNPEFPVESVPEFCKATPIDFDDPLLELVPEAYLDSRPVATQEVSEGMEQLVRENVAHMIRFRMEERIPK
jgi:type I restriction-modification system DNA methylase subunit